MRSRLSRAAGMLCKIRHYVDFDTLKMVYHGIFSSILMYGSLIWGQYNRIVNRLQIIQNKAIRYMTFKPKRTTATPLFKRASILKLEDYIIQYNCLFAHDCLNGNLPTPLLDDRITFVHTNLEQARPGMLSTLIFINWNFKTKVNQFARVRFFNTFLTNMMMWFRNHITLNSLCWSKDLRNKMISF